jgi:hypothetical protein
MATIEFDREKDKLANWETYLLEFDRYSTTLSAALTDSATAVSGDDVSDFPNQGYLLNGSEIIKYDNKTGGAPGAFEVSVRGCFETTAASAACGAAIREPFDKYWGSKLDIIPGGLDISNERALLGMPEGVKASISPDEGKSDIGDIQIDLVNKNNLISKMFSTIPMKNRKATLWAGYENIPASSYEEEFVGLIKGWKPDSNLQNYTLKISDMRRTYRKGLFTQIGKTRLNGSLNNSATAISVNSTVAASAGDRKFTDPASGYDIKTYLQINDEIMGPVYAMSATGFSVTARGVFATIAASHSDEDDVTEIIVFDSRNPITMILQLMTSTGATGSNGTYDVLPSHCGFAIAQALVDVTTFESERDDWTSTYTIGFVIKETDDDGKSWMEKELLRMVGGYIIVDRHGILTLRMYHRQALADSLQVDSDDIVKIVSYNPGHNNIINQILTEYSKTPLNDKFRELWEDINADSISKHGAMPLLTTEFQGIHDEWSLFDPLLDGLNILADYTARMKGRYANPAPEVTVRLSTKHRDVNAGDIIAISHDDLPNLDPASGDVLTGLGVTLEEYEVLSRKMKYSEDDAYVELDILRAIFAEGQVQALNYIYQQYLYNLFAGMVLGGLAVYWDTNRFTLTSNKIRLRALLSRTSAAIDSLRGVLECEDGTEIFSDANIDCNDISIFPSWSWHLVEFTPGASIGKVMKWVGLDRTNPVDGTVNWRMNGWSPNPDPNPDTWVIVYNRTTFAIITSNTGADFTADVAEKLL